MCGIESLRFPHMASGGLEFTGFAVEPKLDCPHLNVSDQNLFIHFS